MDAADWDARYATAGLVWGGEPNRFVVAEFAALTPGRVLDLGAGEGRNANWLASLGWRVTAVDFSPIAVHRGRELAEENGLTIDWIVADVLAYQPEPGGFDAILVCYLHLPGAARATILRRAKHALAAHGRLVVIGHDLTNLADGIGGPQDPDLLYTPEGIVEDLAGLTIHRSERVRRPVHSEHGTVDAIDTVVRAIRE